MIAASTLRMGNVIRFEKELYKVVESLVHAGGGKAGSMVHAKLRNLTTGHVIERRLNPEDKIEDISVTRTKMQMLYRDGDNFCFMNPESYDQIIIPKHAVGPAAPFLKENDVCELEFYEDKPLSVLFPPVVELTVSSTGAGLRGSDSTLKEAVLENGFTVMVPQFIEEGDRIRLDVETCKYLERVSDREVKGAKFTVDAIAQRPETAKPAQAPASPPAKTPKKAG